MNEQVITWRCKTNRLGVTLPILSGFFIIDIKYAVFNNS